MRVALLLMVFGLGACDPQIEPSDDADSGHVAAAADGGLKPDSGVAAAGFDAGPTSLCGQCDGCCLNGACKAGSGHSACGTGGRACSVCNDFQICASGKCSIACDDTTCSGGCCQAGACKAGSALSACGHVGQACGACVANQECRNKACVDVVTVTIKYQWYSSSQPCPYSVCTTSRVMTPPQWNSIAGQYPIDAGVKPECIFSKPAAGQYLLDCASNYCSSCNCPVPAFCEEKSCSWSPPT